MIQQYNIAPDGFTCKYCFQVYKRESSFEKHRCDVMMREENLHSVRGQSAYNLFCKWNTLKKRGQVNKKTFGESKSFSHFYKFAKWKNDVKIPDTQKYISAMVMWDIPPVMWTRDDVYAKFIDFLDSVSTVEDHITYTYSTLRKISEVVECPISQAFQHLELHMVIEYIQARKLSPWIILKIKGFRAFFLTLNGFQKQKLEAFIRPTYWANRIKEQPEDTALIEQFIEQAKL
jgi:hypothetical protein